VTLLVPGDGAAPSGGALCTRRRVETYGGGGGEVQTLGLPVDRDADDGVGEHPGLLGQPPRLVAEDPGGRAAHGAAVELVVDVAVPGAVGGEHPDAGGEIGRASCRAGGER